MPDGRTHLLVKVAVIATASLVAGPVLRLASLAGVLALLACAALTLLGAHAPPLPHLRASLVLAALERIPVIWRRL